MKSTEKNYSSEDMYKIDKTGKKVEELLDHVEDKDIYPEASETGAGLMTPGHVRTLQHVAEIAGETDVGTLSDEEIRMICI